MVTHESLRDFRLPETKRTFPATSSASGRFETELGHCMQASANVPETQRMRKLRIRVDTRTLLGGHGISCDCELCGFLHMARLTMPNK